MALFKKKTVTEAPVVIAETPTYTPESIQRRIVFLLAGIKKIEARLSACEGTSADMASTNKEKLQEVKRELVAIQEEHTTHVQHFQRLVALVNLTAKKESLEKAKRLIDQYDFADMITQREFEKLMKEE